MFQARLGEIGGAASGMALAAILALAPVPGAPALAAAATAAVLAWIAWRDAKDFIVPDGAALALAALGVAVRIADEGATLDAALRLGLDAAIVGGGLWAVREAFYRLRGHDGLGFGDVKLGAASALLVGASGFAVALLAACLAGFAVAALRGGMARDARLPLGALLAPAVWAVFVAGLTSASLT
jgi:prepilin signal peptidase PulO-like enzyme (type II secretory pathway)